ncbi:MAG TPA: hypothetical protein VGQ85_08685 [Candidatus Limnocylindrales bacterium]|nr:hypothetical protein [Candidatus Limnocylindrales bacterium]
MIVTVWGSRGSIASAGPDTVRYGWNASSIQIAGDDATVLLLDAGTGLRRAGWRWPEQEFQSTFC